MSKSNSHLWQNTKIELSISVSKFRFPKGGNTGSKDLGPSSSASAQSPGPQSTGVGKADPPKELYVLLPCIGENPRNTHRSGRGGG